jgi:Oxidoreductase family, NAD-binding Rossmann fold
MAAEGHARAYHRLSDMRVVGIWNRSRDRAEALASRLEHEPRLYDRWQDMISDDRIDVISIATASLLRSEPMRFAVEVAQPWTTRLRPLEWISCNTPGTDSSLTSCARSETGTLNTKVCRTLRP